MRVSPLIPLFFFALLPLVAWRASAEEGGRQGQVDAALQARIDKAIDRGAKWLQGQQRRDGSFPGFADRLDPGTYDPMDLGLNALVVQTLAHCGVTAEDKGLRRCLDFCRFHYSGGNGSWNLHSNGKVMIYSASTVIMALLAMYAPKVAEAPPVKRDRYGNALPPKPFKCKLKKRDQRWIRELVDLIVKSQVKPSGGWRYPGNPIQSEDAPTDMSNTQYALLALEAAERCGILAPIETWKRAAEHILREQDEDGLEVPVLIPNDAWEEGQDPAKRFLEVGEIPARGWGYLPDHVQLATGAMTCAGITGLAICKERLWTRKKLDKDLRKRIDKGLLGGVAWLQDHFCVDDNPDPPSMWHYYYLYGLERTGAKTGVQYVGRHDWYVEGALHLLEAQTQEGGWPVGGEDGRPSDHTESTITQTCFALLFLKRATQQPAIPLAPPVLTGN